MTSKTLFRLKMVLYAVLLIIAELLQTSVFGNVGGRLSPAAMPVAVVCICLFEGSQRGCIFGLIGGCLWAWSTKLGYYGAWCIVILTVIGTLVGYVTEQFLLQGLQTALFSTIPAVLLTKGVYLLAGAVGGLVPYFSFVTVFLPELVISLILCLVFYPLTLAVSKIGGSYG